MKKLDISVLMGLVLTIIISSVTAFGAECSNIREDVLRLHILANSDSEYDQQVKLEVRDTVLAETGILFEQVCSKEEAKEMAVKKLPEIEQSANKRLQELGSPHTAKAEIVNIYFETRVYPDFTLPAGNYDAVRVTIGSGEGKNWWCVVFPSMCVGAARDSMDTLSEEEVKIVSAKPVYEPRFAAVELFQKLKSRTK